MPSDGYDDGVIVCGPDALEIRRYYFPAGTKRVPYADIQSLQRIELKGALTGRWRLWGSSNPRYWANLDLHRPRKRVGFVVDLGRSVSPVVTPERPDEFEAALRTRTGVTTNARKLKGPFI